MDVPRITNRQLLQLIGTYWQWRWLWIGSTAVFAVIGLVYVLFIKGDQWIASQGLIVRDEANGAVMRLGRFESQTEMRAAQETILEMARNSQVLFDALQEVGREPGWCSWFASSKEPTDSEIKSLANGNVTVRAPKGAELGTTEVIYLDVRQSSRKRAVELNKAVCDALENRLKQVRQARASGVIGELLAAKDAAMANLDKATKRLQTMESEAGADLSDLRGLTDAYSNGSTTRLVLDTVRQELLQAELALQQLKVDLVTAKSSYEEPDQLLLTPTKLVNTHTGLKRLREGLSSAAIASSQLQGKFTEKHPLVMASQETEQRLRQELREELGNSVATLTKELEFAQERIEKLKQQQASLEERINRLAEIRASYANVASEVKARNEQLQEAERELSQAEAARDAAETSSLLTRIDQPLIGEKPVGPGRSTILAGTTFGGLFFGFGVVFLLSPIDGAINYGRRRFDYSGQAGRRASDHAEGPIEQRRSASETDALTGSRENPSSIDTAPMSADRNIQTSSSQEARTTDRPECDAPQPSNHEFNHPPMTVGPNVEPAAPSSVEAADCSPSAAIIEPQAAGGRSSLTREDPTTGGSNNRGSNNRRSRNWHAGIRGSCRIPIS